MKDPANRVDQSTPSDLTLPTDKTNQVTPLASPTGVDQEPPEALTTNRETNVEDSPQARVRISDVMETVDADPSPAALPTTRRSILQPTLLAVSQSSNTSLSDNKASNNKTHVKEAHDRSNMLFKVHSDNIMKVTSYHITDFAGLYPVWPIIEFLMAPTGESKDDRMTSFIKCVVVLFKEILHIDNTATIATISITKDESSYIESKADLPTNFTKLGKYIMISGGSWVFNKKAKGSNNVYARFRLKSQVDMEEIVSRVLFEFSCLGGKNLQKKQHQAMKTKMPLMLLFVCNSTDQASIISDTKLMLDTALDDIEQNGMLPEEYDNRDIPHFTLCLNVPRLPAKTKSSNSKQYDHYKEHGKKAFHFKVVKEESNYFRYLSAHAHRLKLKVKYFGKFAKYTGMLGNNAPLSDCTRLHRCIQGQLNCHLSSTSITLNGINMLDALEYLRNPAGKSIVCLTLRDLLYRITLENKASLFLQLSQRSSGEVDAVIPNTVKAELMAKRMNIQIAAWCHFYWKDTNPGAEKFYCKLSDRAFSQVLLHKIGNCTWDSALKAVTSPSAQSEMSAIAEFEQQDWVKLLTQDSGEQWPKKARINPNAAFPFQDNFSVRTIHGAKAKTPTQDTVAAPAVAEIVEIQDYDDDISVLTSKTTSEAQTDVAVGCRVAFGSNPHSGPAANSTQSVTASRGLKDPTSAGPASGAAGGPDGK